MDMLINKTKKASQSSSSSPSVDDRFIRDLKRTNTPTKKISGKGNVMARMKIFSNEAKSLPQRSKVLSTH